MQTPIFDSKFINMCRKIDCYIDAFSSLKTDTGNSKPLLLIAVLDLIAAKKINREFIEISPDLVETYNHYCQRMAGNDSASDLAEPFHDMSEEPFWELAPKHDAILPDEKVKNLEKLKEFCLGARLDPELFRLALMEPLRRKLKSTLVKSYHLKL